MWESNSRNKPKVSSSCVGMNGKRGCDLTQYVSATFPLSEAISTSCRVSGQLVPIEVPAGTASNLSVLFYSLTRQKMGTSSTR